MVAPEVLDVKVEKLKMADVEVVDLVVVDP